MGEIHESRFHRARHDGRQHGGQPAEGGLRARRARHAPRRRRAPSRGRRGLGRQPEGAGRAVRGHLHLAARPAGGRGGGARRQRAARRHEGRQRLFRPVDQLADPGARDQPPLRRKARLHARRAGQRRAARRRIAASSRCGSAATSRSSTATRRCSTRSATRPAISARSAPARSPSWCTTAPATRCRACLAEVFTMGVKAGVEPLALWEAVRAGRRRPAPHLRRAGRPVPAGQIRPAGLRAAPRAQGRVAGDRSSAAS